jgi:hypothetical protein
MTVASATPGANRVSKALASGRLDMNWLASGIATGCMLFGAGAGALPATALPIGSNGQHLAVVAGLPAWSDTFARAKTFAPAAGSASPDVTFTQPAQTAVGSPRIISVTGGAHTGLTASTELTDIRLGLARTVTWATGAIASQRSVLITAPTLAFVGASVVTNAATLAINGAPVAGPNATITASHALWVQAGNTQLDGTVVMSGAATLNNSLILGAASNNFLYYAAATTFHLALAGTGDALTIDTARQVKVVPTTISTSSTTGAFVVNGGVGIAGNVCTAGSFGINCNPSYPLDVGNGLVTQVVRFNGINSGTAGGVALLMSGGGSVLGTLGNVSCIFGGAYDATMAISSISAFKLYTNNTGLALTIDTSQQCTFSGAVTKFGTVATTGTTGLAIDGGNSGSGGGAYFGFRGNGAYTYNNGNASAILGGAYDATTIFYSVAGVAQKFYTNATLALTISTAQVVTVNASTASTNTTTGALVVTGGLGIGGDQYIGGALVVLGNGSRFFPNSGGTYNGNFVFAYDDHFPGLQIKSGSTVKSYLAVDVNLGDTTWDVATGRSYAFRDGIGGGGGTVINLSIAGITVSVPTTSTPAVVQAATATLAASPADGYLSGLKLAPTYNGAFTVTRHNYLVYANPAGTSTITDACVASYDAAAGTHKAVDGATTKTTPTDVKAWEKVNVNGTIYYRPLYLSKTA